MKTGSKRCSSRQLPPKYKMATENQGVEGARNVRCIQFINDLTTLLKVVKDLSERSFLLAP